MDILSSVGFQLAIIFLAIVVVPPLSQLSKRLLPVPIPVCEMALGIIIGPQVFGLINADFVEAGSFAWRLGQMGLAAVIFIAGYEFDFRSMPRRQLGWASGGWVISLALAVGAGVGVVFGANALGIGVQGGGGQSLVISGVFVGIALTSTALSTAMPALRDAGELGTKFGKAIVVAGTIGQLAPLLAISIAFGARGPLWSVASLLGFGLLMAVALWVSQLGLPQCMHRMIKATMHSSGNFAVRLVVCAVALPAFLTTEVFVLHLLVGAFAAGTLMRQLLNTVEPEMKELTERKFQGVAFGLLTPVFFVTTGVAFDLRGLLEQPLALALIPVFVLIMIFARGLPGSFVIPWNSPPRDRVSAMFWTSVGLAVIVVVADIAIQQGALSSVMGAAMVGAGMVSMLTFPTIALAVRGKRNDESPDPTDRL